jgi:chromosome segregation ATPase
MNAEDRNIIQRIEDLHERLGSVRQEKKEMIKDLNDARLQISLIQPAIQTEIALVELEKIEIDFPVFEHLLKTTKAEQQRFLKQLKEMKEEFSDIKQNLIALECDLEILNTSYK